MNFLFCTKYFARILNGKKALYCSFIFISNRYWDTLLDIFWPRFIKIVEMNAVSVKSTDPQKLGSIDIQPHYVSEVF